MSALDEQQHGMAVAEIMEPDARQFRSFQYLLGVAPNDVVAMERLARLLAEDESVILVLPRKTPAVFVLPLAPFSTGGQFPWSAVGSGVSNPAEVLAGALASPPGITESRPAAARTAAAT